MPAALKAKGWSDARAFSHTQLLKNPNSYFYRHVEPSEVQVRRAAARIRLVARSKGSPSCVSAPGSGGVDPGGARPVHADGQGAWRGRQVGPVQQLHPTACGLPVLCLLQGGHHPSGLGAGCALQADQVRQGCVLRLGVLSVCLVPDMSYQSFDQCCFPCMLRSCKPSGHDLPGGPAGLLLGQIQVAHYTSAAVMSRCWPAPMWHHANMSCHVWHCCLLAG